MGQGGAGGFVQLTGEVGTGKTTICRCLLEQVPEETQVALVLNPLMTPKELLATICEELGVETEGISDSNKLMVDALNKYLLGQHASGRHVVVVIDEAQNLSPEALEQVRLLTNLETAKEKLLQMVLLGTTGTQAIVAKTEFATTVAANYRPLSPGSLEPGRNPGLREAPAAGRWSPEESIPAFCHESALSKVGWGTPPDKHHC